ncbi:MAG: FG-GAP-like repeat-containing protein [Micrococcales bacterium]|nr:FG-GAP-like repeat-containing protein [Micrococcales bacterium]
MSSPIKKSAPSSAKNPRRQRRLGAAIRAVGQALPVALIIPATPLIGPAVGASPAAQAAPSSHVAVAAAPISNPVDLVNLWRVKATGEAHDTWLRLDAGSYQLFRACGHFEGGWNADGKVFFAAAPNGMSGACGDAGYTFDPIPWLAAAVSYEPVGKGWRLVDKAGKELALLTIDGAPPPDKNSADFYRQPPKITPEVRAFFKEPVPLPSGLKPATMAMLTGKIWILIGGYNPKAFLKFYADGSWHGSDGCNGRGGEWMLVNNAGKLFTSSGMSTAIGCNNAPIGLYRTTMAGFDGKTLVLINPEGKEFGRFLPKGTSGIGTNNQLLLSPDMTGDGLGELIAAHGNGSLDRYSMASPTKLSAKSRFSYWDRDKLYAPGDWNGSGFADLITVDFMGRMYLRAGDGKGGIGHKEQIGQGWTGYRVIPAGDLTGDGNNDLLAIKESTGELFLYAGNGRGGFKYPYPMVGHGWQGFELYAAGDLNKDGHADLLSVDSMGNLWMYAGRGDGTFRKKIQVGNGWGKYLLATGADLTGDGLADIVGRDNDNGTLYLYKGLGNGKFAKKIKIGTGF